MTQTTATHPDDDFRQVTRRLDFYMAALALLGAAVAFGFAGWQGTVGFVCGGALSWGSFRFLKNLAAGLGGSAESGGFLGRDDTPQAAAGDAPPPTRGQARQHVSALFLGFRYLLVGAAGYVMLKQTNADLTAFLAGLFLATAAVILETVYELIYGTAAS